MGKVFETVNISGFNNMTREVEEYYKEEEKFTENILESSSFNLVYMAKKYDDWFLDPIVGMVIPGVGDVISSIVVLPSLHVAMFKIKSFKLTFAIFYITILDVLCGIIPVFGDIVDAFYKTNKKAARWIVGYVEGDKVTISQVNKSAAWGSVMLIILGILIWALFSLLISIYHWFSNLFTSII